jgi:hypothetical protein
LRFCCIQHTAVLRCLTANVSCMRHLRLSIMTLAIVVCLASLFILPVTWRVWQLRHIEAKSRNRVTAAELQAWATNLLALQPPGGYLSYSKLGTNFPERLRRVYHQPPTVYVRSGESNSPGHVSVMWGSGVVGLVGFKIGATNFVTSGHRWQAGVYFVDATSK